MSSGIPGGCQPVGFGLVQTEYYGVLRGRVAASEPVPRAEQGLLGHGSERTNLRQTHTVALGFAGQWGYAPFNAGIK